jgi:hypothetical protein
MASSILRFSSVVYIFQNFVVKEFKINFVLYKVAKSVWPQGILVSLFLGNNNNNNLFKVQ